MLHFTIFLSTHRFRSVCIMYTCKTSPWLIRRFREGGWGLTLDSPRTYSRGHVVPHGLAGLIVFTLHHSVSLFSHGLAWSHLVSLGLTWIHLHSLGFAWTPLDLLGFTCIHLDSLGLTWTFADSLGLTWTPLVLIAFMWAH